MDRVRVELTVPSRLSSGGSTGRSRWAAGSGDRVRVELTVPSRLSSGGSTGRSRWAAGSGLTVPSVCVLVAALADPAGPPVPVAEAVVRAADVRTERNPGAHPATGPTGQTVRAEGSLRQPVRGGHPGHTGPGLLPAQGQCRLHRV